MNPRHDAPSQHNHQDRGLPVVEKPVRPASSVKAKGISPCDWHQHCKTRDLSDMSDLHSSRSIGVTCSNESMKTHSGLFHRCLQPAETTRVCKGIPVERSLSILLPVHNRQADLRDSVLRVLDLAEQLTQQFEVVIIDDGSTDSTVEVAHDLAREFPQVQTMRHRDQLGLVEVARTGIAKASGDIIFLHEGQGPIEVSDLRQLWKLRDDSELVLARHGRTAASNDGWLERLLGTGENRGEVEQGSGFHMLRREALSDWNYQNRLTASQSELRVRADGGGQPGSQVRRPNFLTKLRQFALGE